MNIDQIRSKAEAGQAEAQFLLSQICFQNRDLGGLLHWLLQASSREHPDALDALGHCYEKGQGVTRDYEAALGHYDRAIRAGSSLAAYHKSELLYKSQQGPANASLILELLVSAAKGHALPALRAIAYLAMQRVSSRSLAIECLRRATLGGDPVSSFNLGWCLMRGWGGDGALPEAAFCLRQAAALQYPFAETLLTDLEGVQAATQLEPPKEPIDPGADISLYPGVRNVEQQIVSEDPAITVFRDVLNIVDCAHLMFLSRPGLKRASVIDPDGGKDGMVSNVRTNLSTYLPFAMVDMIGRYIELKIIAETGEDLASSEPMSILRYAPGECYEPHVDYFNPNLTASRELLEDGGQRIASAVTYLHAPSAGGGTSFPRLKVVLPAVTGSTLWFRNCRADGRIDDRSLHAGDPVEAGEKWVVTKWFRERPTRYLEI